MVFFVRTATERDLEKVGTLLSETWHATYDGLYGVEKVSAITAKWHSLPALKSRLDARGAEFVVADDGREIAGMGYAAASRDDPKLVVLYQLYVLPRFQGQGIGRDMFAEIETCFPDANRMRVEVEPQNTRAIHLYERLGFERVEAVPGHVDSDPETPLSTYEKPLLG